MLRFVLALVLVLGSAAAGRAQSTPAPADNSTVLHLSESAQRALRQDRLTVELRAELTGPDAGRVQAEINRRITAALDRVRAVPSAHAATTGYWVQQERAAANAPVRWHGTQALALTGADSGALLNLAGELQQSGLVTSGLDYDVAPATARAVEDELTAEALQRLRDRAGRIAASMGLVVRSYRELRVGNVAGNRPPRPLLMRAAAPAAAALPPVAEPGETTLQVTAEADVILAPSGKP